MNGGVCNVHFQPFENGIAVDIHYIIAQLLGARYKKHESDLHEMVSEILGVQGTVIDLYPEYFDAPAPYQPKQSESEPSAQTKPKFCSNCGNPVQPGASFCGQCGNKL